MEETWCTMLVAGHLNCLFSHWCFVTTHAHTTHWKQPLIYHLLAENSIISTHFMYGADTITSLHANKDWYTCITCFTVATPAHVARRLCIEWLSVSFTRVSEDRNGGARNIPMWISLPLACKCRPRASTRGTTGVWDMRTQGVCLVRSISRNQLFFYIQLLWRRQICNSKLRTSANIRLSTKLYIGTHACLFP